MDIFIGIILILSALFLIIAVLKQSGKDKSLSGTIAGGSADTFYGKTKNNSNEKKLSAVLFWMTGSFAGAAWADVLPVFLSLVVCSRRASKLHVPCTFTKAPSTASRCPSGIAKA